MNSQMYSYIIRVLKSLGIDFNDPCDQNYQNRKCLPDCFYHPRVYVVDSFSGRSLDISALNIPDDYNLLQVSQNGSILSPNSGGATRDYGYSGGVISFEEAKDECRIHIQYFECVEFPCV